MCWIISQYLMHERSECEGSVEEDGPGQLEQPPHREGGPARGAIAVGGEAVTPQHVHDEGRGEIEVDVLADRESTSI